MLSFFNTFVKILYCKTFAKYVQCGTIVIVVNNPSNA